jgi:tetratricopeptide (TPR) repeat protein
MGATTFIVGPEPDREEILTHLHQILTDRRFASAERNARFLRFVVESTLDGKASEIKETVIATEVYGRSRDYDPKADSIVRVEASRLRQKLRSYYENEGKNSGLRFHLPSGSYVPSFDRLDETPVLEDMTLEMTEGATAGFQVLGAVPARRSSIGTSRLVAGTGLFLMAVLFSMHGIKGSKTTVSQIVEAMAAWQEGVALMGLDPHTAQTASGPPNTLLRAIERLEFSVARNPMRAQAWASLAEAYDYAYSYVGRDLAEDASRMDAAARRAIALDRNLAAGHHMQGLLLKGIKWDFPQAELAYKRALQLDPHNAWAAIEYADLLWETGRIAQAAAEIRKARALVPALPAFAAKEAEIQLDTGRPDAALVTARSAAEMKRTSLRVHVVLGMAYERKGDNKSALASYAHVLEADPADRRALPAYGYLLARTGQTVRAREVAAQLEKMNSTVRNCAVQVAMVYAGLGEDELALDWLERAWHTRQTHFPFTAAGYRFGKFHQNPRFKEILNRVGLKPVASQQDYVPGAVFLKLNPRH